MRTFGIVLIVIGSLDLIISIITVATGEAEAAARYFSGALMLLVIGGLLLHSAKKKEESEEEKKNWDK